MLSLIPISDANPTKNFPIVTVVLIAINIAVFFLAQPGFGTSTEATFYFYENAGVPCQLEQDCPDMELTATGESGETLGPVDLGDEPSLTGFLERTLYSTFFHGGFLHIGFNMLFLWVFGNNIEDFLGRAKYVVFYLLGGIAAGLAHALWTLRLGEMSEEAIGACLNGASEGCHAIGQYVPAVGASGAVAAVMGAYLILYPRHKINVLIPIVIIWTVIRVSAFIVLALWFVYQFWVGGPDIAQVGGHSGVAWMAHVGGFVFGVLGILLLGGRPHPPHHGFVQPGWR